MRNIFYLILSASFFILSACDSAEQEASVSSDVVENYSEIVLANYKDTYEDAMLA